MTEENKIKDTAEAVKALVEAVPVYQDLVQPAAKEIGTAAGKIVKAALSPVLAMVWGLEKIGEWLVPALAKRLKDVPKDRVVTPNPTVAGPALEALRFAGNEPDLREMYANLLANAMDAEKAHIAHPAFVEILRQLSSEEAKLLQVIITPGKLFPLVSVADESDQQGGRGSIHVLRHISTLGLEAGCKKPQLTTQYIENLCRLGLCEIPPMVGYVNKAVYKPLEDRHEIQGARTQIESREGHKCIVHYEMVQLTAFGRLFCDACVTTPTDEKPAA